MATEVLCFGLPELATCREIAEWVDDFFGGTSEVRHLSVWEHGDSARRHDVRSVPTVIVSRDGEEIARLYGRPGRRAQRRLAEQTALVAA